MANTPDIHTLKSNKASNHLNSNRSAKSNLTNV